MQLASQIAAILTLGTALAALWIRRHTWTLPWEFAATFNVALQAFDVVLAYPRISPWASSRLHRVFGLWNLQHLLGHCCYLVGMTAIVYTVVSRLDMSHAQLAWFVRKRIELPMTVVVALMVAVFVTGGLGNHRVTDLTLVPAVGWLRCYWLIMLVACLYLMAYACQALLILRRAPDSRGAANVYLAAIGVSALCCIAFALAIEQAQHLLVRAEVIAYAIAAAYSWRMRARRLHRSPNPLPT